MCCIFFFRTEVVHANFFCLIQVWCDSIVKNEVKFIMFGNECNWCSCTSCFLPGTFALSDCKNASVNILHPSEQKLIPLPAYPLKSVGLCELDLEGNLSMINPFVWTLVLMFWFEWEQNSVGFILDCRILVENLNVISSSEPTLKSLLQHHYFFQELTDTIPIQICWPLLQSQVQMHGM